MADKFGVLKTIIGEELYNRVLDAVGQKEGEAAKAEMSAKEAKDAEVTEKAMAQTAADDEKAEIDPKTGKPKKPKNAAQAAEEAAEAKKEAGDGDEDEALVAIFTKVVSDAQAPLLKRLEDMEASQVQTKKEYEEAITKRFGVIEASIKEAKDGVTELLGDMPKSVKRASEAAHTATAKAQALGEKAGPAEDPATFDFFRDFLMTPSK